MIDKSFIFCEVVGKNSIFRGMLIFYERKKARWIIIEEFKDKEDFVDDKLGVLNGRVKRFGRLEIYRSLK